MKQEFTREYMDNNTGCFKWIEDRVERMYLESGYVYSEDTILSALEIVNMNVSFKKWMWFFVSQCELTQEEFDTLKVDLAQIVLPIWQEKYPNTEITTETIMIAADEDNYDAYNAAQSQVSDKAGSVCMYVAHAVISYRDNTYLNLVKDYLRNFVQQ